MMILVQAGNEIYEFDERLTQSEFDWEMEELKKYCGGPVCAIGELPQHLIEREGWKMQDWIHEVTLVPENKTYKVDQSYRVAIPKHLVAKFGIVQQGHMEYYTAYIDGKWFLCMTKTENHGHENEKNS